MSEMMSTTKLLVFSGKKEDFVTWKTKFMALARKKGYQYILQGKMPEKMSEEDITKNDDGLADLTLVLQNKSDLRCLNAVRIAQKGLDNGSLAKAWEILCQKHQPNTTTAKSLMLKSFHNNELTNEKTNPEDWIAELEEIQKGLLLVHKYKLKTEVIAEHVINNLPEMYNAVLGEYRRKLATGEAIDFDEIVQVLSDHWAREQARGKVSKNNNSNDTAFHAFRKLKGTI